MTLNITEQHEAPAKSLTTWLSTYQPSRSHGAPQRAASNLQSNKRYKLQDITKCIKMLQEFKALKKRIAKDAHTLP